MPRKKRSTSPLELYDDDFDEDASSHSSQPPVQRNAANARERMRMRVLSSAYGRLKTKLPNIPPDTKLSKLDTLRLATLYIKQLINAVETGSSPASHNNPISELLDPRHLGTECGNPHLASPGGMTTFNFHNAAAGQLGMSWPFEFHQQGHTRNSNLTFSSAQRMDWQPNYAKMPRQQQQQHQQEQQQPNDISYTQLQDAQWYPADMSSNNCCAYDNITQHQRGLTIANANGHTLGL